ncbi:NAD-dependent epimerase/dehydratase family protein [Pseudomonas fontis]|uniref:NAD(P)-dependent oxidoreductase n=1 Tax=Pseudomonas fontis TaxID=2942633 RepID=A0ABT5NZC4_9PSED|nr:NAD(P)-dependent oxidoreductase [Pseudomonas fontis]MDD0976765.1 NAD(P)-dependent oxidoreductase [Pseudomonas fontis]MDD0993530.1 NAD(P)-dependent oxidoreductase [Pseudomonas fontis]
MKTLVIGSTSVIGTALANAFCALGEVKTAGRRDADIFFDLSQWDSPVAVSESFDVVVLAAADFGGTTADDLIRAELVNSVGTLAACRLAQQCSARQVILLSSIWASHTPQDHYFSIYSLSKRHAEEVASLFCAQHAIDLTILRPSQVYDAQGACRAHQPLLYRIADDAQAGNAITFYGNNDARRNYLHLDDLTAICTRVAQQRTTGLFSCVHPQSPRLSEIAQAAFAAFSQTGTLRFLSDKADIPDIPAQSPDNAFYASIGYWPRIDMNEGFALIRQQRELGK